MNTKQIIWLLFFSLFIHPIHAQKNPWSRNVILQKTNPLSLRSILRELTEQTDARFVYVDSLVDGRQVHFKFQTAPFKKIFHQIIDQTGLGYTVLPNQTIVLHRKKMIKSQTNSTSQKEQFTPPQLILPLEPEYPRIARKKGVEGCVKMRLLISEEGTVTLAKIHQTSGSGILDRAALAYAEKLQYYPALMGGHATKVWVKWTVNYVLQDHMDEESGQVIREAKPSEYLKSD